MLIVFHQFVLNKQSVKVSINLTFTVAMVTNMAAEIGCK